MGAVDALDCGEGGGIAGTTRTRMTRKRTLASSPTAAAAAATTAIAHCSTAGGVATMTRGPGNDNGDVEAPAVRVTDW
jgi:Ni,Fe-hydrogenase I small subunit